MKQMMRCVISLRTTKTEDPSTGSFVKKVQSTKMNGTTTFPMVTGAFDDASSLAAEL
jgi:hypothetical protein